MCVDPRLNLFYGPIHMQKIIFIALAGLAGTVLRYWLAGLVARQYGENFPWGTLVVNLIGSFLAGAIYHLAEERLLISPTCAPYFLSACSAGLQSFHPTACKRLHYCETAK